jgi:CubicO group peptidase (beta-lactamase class C family)
MISFLLFLFYLHNGVYTSTGHLASQHSTKTIYKSFSKRSLKESIIDLSKDFEEAPSFNSTSETEQLLSHAKGGPKNILGYVLLKNGEKIAEYTRDDLPLNFTAQVYSATKSWTGLIIGMMIDNGDLYLNETLFDIWPDTSDDLWQNVTYADALKNATIESLLTHTSGLIDDYSKAPTSFTNFTNFGGKTLRETLDMVLFLGDGAVNNFNYFAAGNIFGYVIKERTGYTAEEYANKYIMPYVGINPSEYSWWYNAEGVSYTYFGMNLSPHQLAKLGQLYLQGGLASETKQVVSKKWTEESFTPHAFNATIGDIEIEYGYLWGINSTLNATCAIGLGGQFCCVFPEKDMVLSVLSETFPGDTSDRYKYTEEFVGLVSSLSFDTEADATSEGLPNYVVNPIVAGLFLLACAWL